MINIWEIQYNQSLITDLNTGFGLAIVGMLVVFIALSLTAIVISLLNQCFYSSEHTPHQPVESVPQNASKIENDSTLIIILAAASAMAMLQEKDIK